jgi:magnesium-transporting ATPase (P-type)
MGGSGTDVARQTADLVLTDDNFASIVDGIEEGRVAYDNVRKVIWLLLATGVAEVVLFSLAVIAAMPLPLLPVQLLWLNLVTNGLQDVALAFERGEPGVLKRPPRDVDQPIFDRTMIEQVLSTGSYMGVVAFAVFYYLVSVQGMAAEPARNLVLLLMVLFENVHTLSCRSEHRSVFVVPLRDNPLLLGAIVLAHGIHIAAMFTPGLSTVLGVVPVSPGTWGLLLLLSVSVLVPDELSKRLRGGSGERARQLHTEARP